MVDITGPVLLLSSCLDVAGYPLQTLVQPENKSLLEIYIALKTQNCCHYACLVLDVKMLFHKGDSANFLKHY